MSKGKRKKILGKCALLLVTLGLLAVYVYPFILVLINSFKSRAEVMRNPMALPESLGFDNFISAFNTMNFPTAFMNSFVISAVSLVILIIFPAMLAYFLVRWRWKFNKVIFLALVISMMVPFQVVMLPFVIIYGSFFGVLDSQATLIFAYLGFGVAQSTFLCHGFIKGVPRELEEAAAVDGANKFRVFFQIVFPMLKPITSTIAILNILWIWNDYLLPSLVLTSPGNRTIPLSTFAFFGRFTTEFGVAMAALLLAVIPIIIFYLFLQKHIIRGIVQGGLK